MVALTTTSSTYPGAYATQPRYQVASTTSAWTPPALPAMTWDSYSKVSSMVANGAGGAWASYKFSEDMAESMFNYSQLGDLSGAPGMAMASFKEMGGIAMKGAGVSALVTAGISAVSNGISLAKGTVDTHTAARNVVGDTITGAVGGLAAVTLGGLGGLALVKMGMTGLPVTIASVAIGAATGVGAAFIKDKIMNKAA